LATYGAQTKLTYSGPRNSIMRTLRLNAANTTEIANAAAEQLRDGAVIAAPTETVYGLM